MNAMADTLTRDPPAAASRPMGAGRLITIPPRPKATPAAEQMRMLSRAILLEERPPPRFLGAAVLLVAAIVIGTIAWAAIASVASTAAAPGQVVPSGSVRIVQHLEGGIIDEILIGEGDLVEEGQLLMRLDQTAVLAELDQLRARRASLRLRSIRLAALLDGTIPDFGPLSQRFPGMAADQLEVFESERQAAEDERDVLRSQIEQRREEVNLEAERRASLEEQSAVMQEQVAIRSELFTRGVGSRVVLLDTQREASRIAGDLASARVAVRQAEIGVMESQRLLAEFETRRRSDATSELAEVNAELSEIQELIYGQEDRLARLGVTAPVRGVVNGLEVSTPGQVADRGAVLLTLVPLDERVVIETRIQPGDIGFIEVGQSAEVMVDGFPVSRYGSLTGRVERISATSFEDEEGNRHYVGRIALDQDHLAFNGAHHPIQPGMTATVSITTGDQTILDYLLRPVFDSLRRAFSER